MPIRRPDSRLWAINPDLLTYLSREKEDSIMDHPDAHTIPENRDLARMWRSTVIWTDKEGQSL